MDGDRACLCPIRGIINVIGRKWAICVISALMSAESMRFTELKAALEGISSRSLSNVLSTLEREGLVERRYYPEIPPRVEYSLTDMGRSLGDALRPLLEWIRAHDLEGGDTI
jgi:DNA-binding HxlR family transcriptional regulator